MEKISFLKKVLIGFFLYTSNIICAQDNTDKLLFLKFSNYSVMQNKLVQDKLKNEKIIYACIPSGIVVIESQSKKVVKQTEISDKLRQVKTLLTFEFLMDYNISQAEEACSIFRNLESNNIHEEKNSK